MAALSEATPEGGGPGAAPGSDPTAGGSAIGRPPALPRPGSPGAWLLAARPKTLPAAMAPVLVGSGLAAADARFAAGPALAALAGALLIQIATNFANDYYDFLKGADTEARLGPTRAAQAGLLPPSAVRTGALVTFGLATLAGLYLTWVAGWPIVVIGVLSIAAGLAYTAGPFPLAYMGLGEPFVFLFFGLVAVGGTYYVQALDVTPGALLAGVGVGALSTAILVVNNLRDLETDAAVGKRTMAVRLGPGGTRAELVLLVVLAFAVPAAGVLLLGWSPATLLVIAALPLAGPPLRTALHYRDPRELNPALGATARLLTAYAGLLTLGLVL